MPTVGVYQLSDLTYTGVDPWPAGANADSDAVGVTTFTLALGASPIQVEITDDDTELDDNDHSQNFAAAATVNGTNYSVGQNFENEYSYAVRPVGSTDPGDVITVYAIDEGGATPTFAIAATDPLVPGVEYEIIAVDTNNPSVAYTDLFVCFATGTCIRTPRGEIPVEALGTGDLVSTLDSGPQPVIWKGQRSLTFGQDNANQRPILFKAGAFGANLPARDLRLSPQHRVLVNLDQVSRSLGVMQGLAAAVGFEDQPRIRRMRGCREVTYHTVLLPGHEVIFAEGVPVESLYPTEYSVSLLSVAQRLQIHAALPRLMRDVENSYGLPARPFLETGFVRNLPHLPRAVVAQSPESALCA